MGEPLESCPWAMVDAEALEAVETWAWAQRGFLPRAGGVDDQLNKDLECIRTVEAARIKLLAPKDKRR